MPRKVECIFCHKKFGRKGIPNHKKWCRKRPSAPTPTVGDVASFNLSGLSPHARLIKAANEYWEQMSDQQKLRACAFISFTGERGI